LGEKPESTVSLPDFVIPLIEMCGCDWFKPRHVV